MLLKSSANSWLRTEPNIQPDLEQYPDVGFPVEGERASPAAGGGRPRQLRELLQGQAVAAAQAAQPAQAAETQAATEGEATPTPAPQTSGVVESSPDTARLVVIGSGEFLTDVVFQISSSMTPNRYLNSLQLVQNAVDWSVEDLDLLAIRARGQSTRVLAPLTPVNSGSGRFRTTAWRWPRWSASGSCGTCGARTNGR